jgi:hypothetical protein
MSVIKSNFLAFFDNFHAPAAVSTNGNSFSLYMRKSELFALKIGDFKQTASA